MGTCDNLLASLGKKHDECEEGFWWASPHMLAAQVCFLFAAVCGAIALCKKKRGGPVVSRTVVAPKAFPVAVTSPDMIFEECVIACTHSMPTTPPPTLTPKSCTSTRSPAPTTRPKGVGRATCLIALINNLYD